MVTRKKAMILPILLALAVAIYYAVYFLFLISRLTAGWKMILGLAPLLLAIVFLKIGAERIMKVWKSQHSEPTAQTAAKTEEDA